LAKSVNYRNKITIIFILLDKLRYIKVTKYYNIVGRHKIMFKIVAESNQLRQRWGSRKINNKY
jgi:hypothetical protein